MTRQQLSLESQLWEAKPEQGERFLELRGRFAEDYESASRADDAHLLRDDWARRNRELERALLPEPPFDFLRHPAILYTMFVSDGSVEPELGYLRRRWDDETLGALLEEDPVGAPLLLGAPGEAAATSANAVHHLHHLAHFTASTGVHPREVGRVVEWGGGYGSFARLFLRLDQDAPTYVIVDTAIFSCLQRLYLETILGHGATRLIAAPGQRVAAGKINLVPAGLVEQLELSADLFVSTWALNESSRFAQEYVVGCEWFGARRLLLGMHDCEWLIEAAARDGARREPIGAFMPNQNYIFR